jgi:hypothetical protein
VTLAEVQSETERLSPLTNFDINFIDRQRLKMTEDKILDLVIIFESLYNTLSKLHIQCRNHCLGDNCKDCNCASTLDELEDQMHDVQLNLKKADILYKRAQSTAKLVRIGQRYIKNFLLTSPSSQIYLNMRMLILGI